MEQPQVPLVNAAVALGGSSSVVTLAQVSDAKAVEVRADGIYETSNQQEATTPVFSRQASTSSSAPFEKPDHTCEDPVASNASPLDELKPAEPLEPAYSSFNDVDVPEPQVSSDGGVERPVTTESEGPVSSSVIVEQISTEELQNNTSPPLATRAPVDTSSSKSSEPPASTASSVDQDLKVKRDNVSFPCSMLPSPLTDKFDWLCFPVEPQNESCAVDEATLSKVQDFLIEKTSDLWTLYCSGNPDPGEPAQLPRARNPRVYDFIISRYDSGSQGLMDSHSVYIDAVVGLYLSDKQKKLHFPSLIQCIVAHFNRDALAQGREDVSLDVQSSICLLEQTFLTFGRVSPLQDMYTAEEEDLLDQLGVLSSQSDKSPRSSSS